jgi:hypothetical protein
MKRILRKDLFQRVAKNIGKFLNNFRNVMPILINNCFVGRDVNILRNLSASLAHCDAAAKNYPANKDLVPVFVNNKNPHNLEKLRIAEKISGWDLEVQEKSFWNK